MINLSTGLRAAMCGTIGIAGAFTNSVLYIYSGAQPASADAAVQGNLCAIITLASGAFVFGSPTNGLNLDAATIPGSVQKTGAVWSGLGLRVDVAGWWRLMGNALDNLGASTTLARMDGNIATGGGDMNLGTTAVAVGVPLTIDVFQYTLPAN
jgi:hypothetical protein